MLLFVMWSSSCFPCHFVVLLLFYLPVLFIMLLFVFFCFFLSFISLFCIKVKSSICYYTSVIISHYLSIQLIMSKNITTFTKTCVNPWGSCFSIFLCFFDFYVFRFTVSDYPFGIFRDSRGSDRMVVAFITTYVISTYHHWWCEFEPRPGWGVQHYVIKFVSD